MIHGLSRLAVTGMDFDAAWQLSSGHDVDRSGIYRADASPVDTDLDSDPGTSEVLLRVQRLVAGWRARKHVVFSDDCESERFNLELADELAKASQLADPWGAIGEWLLEHRWVDDVMVADEALSLDSKPPSDEGQR